ANILVVYATPHPFPLNVYLGTLADGLGCFPLDYESYHTQSDSQREVAGIRSLNELGNPMRVPRSISALPPVLTPFEASPKAISERTSYIRVRLACRPDPLHIAGYFDVRGFRPPVRVTCAAPWTWVDHTVTDLRLHTKRPDSRSLPLRPHVFHLAF